MKGGLHYHRSFLYVGMSSFLLGALWWGGTMRVEAVVNLNTFLAPGHMINLTYGEVHYQWHGPTSGPLVVLVHGITSNEGVMGWLAKDLASEGYRVLTYDLYGRGHSDNAKGHEHTHDLFTHQINELLSALGRGNDTFTLIGYSMGGAIATIYTAQYGHRVEKLVLVSPAGLPLEFPLAARIGNLPYIGEFIANNQVFKYFFTATAAESFIAPHVESEYIEYIVRLAHFHVSKSTFFDALLSTLRHFPLNDAMVFYKRVGEQSNIPVLLMWGTQDQMCPYSGAEVALNLIPHAELVTLENAGHAALLENSTVVNSAIANFLNSDTSCGNAYSNITYTSPYRSKIGSIFRLSDPVGAS